MEWKRDIGDEGERERVKRDRRNWRRRK